jgi:hypothetical protein
MAEVSDQVDVKPQPQQGPNQNVAQHRAATIERLQAWEISTIAKLNEPLNNSNWTVWKERMKQILRLCRADKYAAGTIQHPADAVSGDIWDYNDNYAQVIIVSNVSSLEMVHISQWNTAGAMWKSLVAVHEAKGHQTIIAVIQNLLHTIVSWTRSFHLFLS